MKLPPADQREGFYQDLILQCMQSRETRKAQYERRRAYYLFGSDENRQPAIHNKIYPSIDTLVSFLFAVDTTRFAIELGTSAVKKANIPMVPPLIQRVNNKWQDSNADIIVSDGITWALVYDSMIVKLCQRRGETLPFLIAPHNFGVLDESQTMLDRQEAFVQTFVMPRAMLYRELQGHPNRDAIMRRITAAPHSEHEMDAGLQRVIVNSQAPLSGGYTGNIPDVYSGSEMYRPQTPEDMVEMYELWVWSDEAKDYQVATIADPMVCIYDRPSGKGLFMPGEHPFTQLCPNPAPNYFFGYSEVQRLIGLQNLREHHLEQLTRLIDKNVTTDKAASGVWGAVEEKDYALRMLGALVSAQDPTAKIQEFKPTIPPDIYKILAMIDDMFDETISLNNLSKGQGDTGVRSKGQTESLLRVGSSRPKKRALTIEDALERIATQYLKLDQQHDEEVLTLENPITIPGIVKPVERFISSQFTNDYMVKVDAHSSSPIFVEDQKMEAKFLLEAGIIDGESYIDLTQPMNAQVLKEKYKVLAKNRSEQAAKEFALEAAVANGKVSKLQQSP